MNNRSRLNRNLFYAGLGIGLFAAAAGAWGSTIPAARTLSATQQHLAGIAVPFIENRGQLDPRVAYYARTFAGTAFVTRTGALVLSLPGKPLPGSDATRTSSFKRGRGWVLSETPVSRVPLRPQGDTASPTRVAVFQGRDPRHWQSDLPTFRAVNLGQPWPGIGYAIRAHGDNIERVFTVAPGADARAIRMRIRGVERLTLEHDRLVAHTGNGPVTLTRPAAYQLVDGKRHSVRVAYVLHGHRYGFRLGRYDPRQPVVIDPLVQATYLGGSGQEDDFFRGGIAVGSGGQVYVVGDTTSTDFPGTSGGAQPANNGGNFDGFVAELSADLKTLIQATYLGGSGDDHPQSLTLASGGQVYVVGETSSIDFPGTAGSVQPTNNGGNSDGFVAELSADLKTLVQSSYLGGSGEDDAEWVSLGGNGQLYVSGFTDSTDFPGTAGGAQAASGGGGDAFVAELSGDLKTLVQSTYLGGSSADFPANLVVNGAGNVYIAGGTQSTDFPGTAGGAQPTNAGGIDLFVAELSGDLKNLVQATYLGGANMDATSISGGRSLALGSNNQLYVSGFTQSTNFPGTSGGAQPTNAGGDNNTNMDDFVAELSGDLKTLIQATYLGGSGNEGSSVVAVDNNGNVYIAGNTDSTDFPDTAGGAQPANGGGPEDVFIAELTGDLKTLTQATYLGGTSTDAPLDIALGNNAEIYVTGYTASTDFPATAGGAQPVNSGQFDAFVALFDSLAAVPPPTVSAPDVSTTANTAATVKITLTGSGTLTLTATSSNQTLLPDSGITGQNACTAAGTCTLKLMPEVNQAGVATVALTVKDSHGQSGTGQFKFTVNAAPPPPAKSQPGGAIGLWTLFGLLGLTAWRLRRRTARRSR